MASLTVSVEEPYAMLRLDPGAASGRVRAELDRLMREALEKERWVRFSERKDPIKETVTFAATVAPPTPDKIRGFAPNAVWFDDLMKHNPYTLSESAQRTVAAAASAAAKKPTLTDADFAQIEARVMAKVSAALDAVEGEIIPGADPAFVILLLRDRLKNLTA